MNTFSRWRGHMRRSVFLTQTALAFALAVWQTGQAAEGQGKLALKEYATGFTSPVTLTSHPEKPDQLVVVDQAGVVSILGADGVTKPEAFLDVREKLTKLRPTFDERGLLSLAFHPKFKENDKFYVAYNAPLRKGAPEGWDSTLTVCEFQATKEGGMQADPATERVILQIDKPAFNHNGGCLAFGPDGYLYMSVGDGGDGNDTGLGHAPEGNGQNKNTLLAKILRIDVNKAEGYGIPSDNPFAKGGGRPEIFAYGVRNSWRISFDRGGNHELFAADVGQTLWEEVNIIINGGNYGWRIREGYGCFNPNDAAHAPEDCPKVDADGKPLIEPAFAYKNANGFRKDPEAYGISITGGFVYRGKALPELTGRYIFGDWSSNFVVASGTLLIATPPSQNGSSKWTIAPFETSTNPKGHISAFIVGIGQDADGEIYFLTNSSNRLNGKNGKVWKLVRAAQ